MSGSTSIVRLAALTSILLSFGLGCGAKAHPESAREHLQAGNQLLTEGRIALATAEFEQAVRLDPESVEAQVQLANITAARGQVGAAEARFEALLDRHPDNSMVLAGWGRLLAATGRLEQARRALHRAVESDLPSTEAAVDLARVLTALGRDEEAITAFARASELGASESTAFLLGWAEFLQQQGNLGESLTRIEQAVSLAPADPSVLEALGRAYLDRGRPAEALNILQRALAATEQNSPDYVIREQELHRAAAAIPRTTARPDMPNVLLVVIDTLRADHVGTYGYGRPTTPNIDHLAERAVVFETVVSQAPWTAPAMASLFTGLYPSVHGLDGGIVWGGGVPPASLPFAVQKALPPGHQTLAEIFRQAGYSTAGFVSNLYVNSIFGFAQGFDHFDDEFADYNFEQGEVKRRAEVTNERVFEWLRSGTRGTILALRPLQRPPLAVRAATPVRAQLHLRLQRFAHTDQDSRGRRHPSRGAAAALRPGSGLHRRPLRRRDPVRRCPPRSTSRGRPQAADGPRSRDPPNCRSWRGVSRPRRVQPRLHPV